MSLLILTPYYNPLLMLGPVNGYVMGGRQSNQYGVNNIQKFDLTLLTASNLAATLSTQKCFTTGVNSSTSGYQLGGYFYTSAAIFYATIDGLLFSTETAYNPGSTLADGARAAMGGLNSTTRGYACGGIVVGSAVSSIIDGIQFSNESAINPTASLVLARDYIASGNSSIKGYCYGGYNGGAAVNEIDGLLFSTETTINPTAATPVATYWSMGVNSLTKAYFAGGAAYTTSIQSMVFDTDTLATPGATLATGRAGGAGVNSTTEGYFLAGHTALAYSSLTLTSEIDGISFATETSLNPAAGIAVQVSTTTGVQSGGVL